MAAANSGAHPSAPSQPRAFLITPLSAATAREDEARYLAVRSALETAAAQAGVDLFTSADIFEPGVVIDQVKRAISSANVIIAVCTGRNANVFYELGLAETRGYVPILIAPSKDDLPFDVQHWRSVMYEDEDALSNLAGTVARFITAALDAQTSSSPSTDAGRDDAIKAALLAGDKRGHQFQLKESIRVALQKLDGAAYEHWDQQDEGGYEALAGHRHDAAATVLRILTQVVAIAPDWLAESLRLVTDAGSETLRAPERGTSQWARIRFSWQYLVLRSLVAAAVLDRQPAALGTLLLSLNAPDDSDRFPLMLSDRFTWSESYAGNAWLAFRDFLGLLESRPSLLAGLGTTRRTPTQVACGADVITGLARCVREDRDTSKQSRPPSLRPHVYASFTHFEPWESVWAARLVTSDENLARALGASSMTHLIDVAQRWFPQLAGRHDVGASSFLGLRWDEYLGYE